MTKQEEMSIIIAVKQGRTEQFEDLVLEHQRGIYTLCLRMLGNDQDALDASQETFLRAFRALGSFRGESRFSTWLYRLSSNICLDMLRKRPAAPDISLTDETGEVISLPDTRPGPQQALETAELRLALRQGIMQLAPGFRQALILRDVNGLSYEEIGDITGLEPGTVKSRIFRARKKLAEIIMLNGNFSELDTSFSSAPEISEKGGM